MAHFRPGSERRKPCLPAATRDQRFAEPVALSSTTFADFPLPRTAFASGFDLVALRARRRWKSRGHSDDVQGRTAVKILAICEEDFHSRIFPPGDNGVGEELGHARRSS